jgi:GxxExxY protein
MSENTGDHTKEIIGAIFRVYNTLGYGYREKEYQKALAEELAKLGLRFQRELYSFLKYGEKIIAKFYVDFLVENCVVVELKIADDVYRKHFQQLLAYLKNHNLKVGLLAVFTANRVIIKRIVN